MTDSAAIATTFGKNLLGDHRRHLPDEFASIIYNRRTVTHNDHSCGETNHAASEPKVRTNQHYGRQIPESESEEILTETGSCQQRRPEEKSGHRRQIVRRQEAIGVVSEPSLLHHKSGETVSLKLFAWAGAGPG